jgi:uncharacterized membrane-anchored protein
MKRKFIIIVLFQVMILVGIIAYRQYWVATGARVLLSTESADPRDIFRGDYVTLNYEISSLNHTVLGTEEKFRPKEHIYVVLEKDPDNIYKAVSVSRTRPAAGKFIQGRAGDELELSKLEVLLQDDAGKRQSFSPRWFSGVDKGDRAIFCIGEKNTVLQFYKEEILNKPKCNTGKSISGVVVDIRETKTRQLRVDYGIESYFVEEGKGKAIEAARNAKSLNVEVSLRKDGKGIITGLFLDNKLLR